MVNITLQLPEDLAERAEAAGLLTSERVAEWLRGELERKQRVQTLFADIDKLHALKPELTEAEINKEIRA